MLEKRKYTYFAVYRLKSHFWLIKWVFLFNYDDDNNFIKTILKILFMSDFWLGVINLKKAEHFKKIKRRN